MDKNGNPLFWPSGKPKMEIDAIAHIQIDDIQIDDAFGFYQRRFVSVTKDLVSQGYMAQAQHDEIAKNKEERDQFHTAPMEQIKQYCNEELIALSKALTILRDGFDRMGIRLRMWFPAQERRHRP